MSSEELCAKLNLFFSKPELWYDSANDAIDLIQKLCQKNAKLIVKKIGSTLCLCCQRTLSDNADICTTPKCFHSFHKECLRKNILMKCDNEPYEDKLKKYKCLDLGCRNTIPLPFIRDRIFGSDLWNNIQDELVRKLERQFREIDEIEIKAKTEKRIFECPICIEEKLVNKECITLDCDHKLCKDCLKKTLTTYLNEGKVSEDNRRCPVDNKCKVPINMPVIETSLTRLELDKFLEFTLNDLKPSNSNEFYVRCPGVNCKYIFIYTKGRDTPFPTCQACRKQFCVEGCEKPHVGSTCAKYKEWKGENGQADNMFQNYVAANKLKMCPSCKWMCEKISGCNHMTCRCQNQFCYVCGGSWSSSHRCS
jgi:E3 ubiquitin-protein ligase RNF144